MKPLEINLAASPYRNDLPLAVLLAALGLAAVGFTAHNTYAFLTADARTGELREELAGHRARMEQMKVEAGRIEKDLAGVDAEVVGSQADFVASILAERNFSWTQLFNELERVVPWDVKLVSVRPVFNEGKVQIQLQGLARTLDSFFELQEVLAASERFGEVVPNSYEHPEPGDQRVRFDMTFAYSPPTGEAASAQAVAGPGQAGGEGGEGAEAGEAGDAQEMAEDPGGPEAGAGDGLQAETGPDARRAGGPRDRQAPARAGAAPGMPGGAGPAAPGPRRRPPGAAAAAGDPNDAGMATLAPAAGARPAAGASPTPVEGRTIAPARTVERPAAAAPGAPRGPRDLQGQRPTEVTYDEQGRPKITPRRADPTPPPDQDSTSDAGAPPDEDQP
ncbi:MAG: PilN domain-containing protein [Acidobacteria bacterium]|nr:PilN domain-containing protein [Acidobacteriota bacterium]